MVCDDCEMVCDDCPRVVDVRAVLPTRVREILRPTRARESVAKIAESLFRNRNLERLCLHEADALSPPLTKSYGTSRVDSGPPLGHHCLSDAGTQRPARRAKETGMSDVVRSDLRANVRWEIGRAHV